MRDVQRNENLWASFLYGEIVVIVKAERLMQVFVGEVRDLETDSRTPTKMGKD